MKQETELVPISQIKPAPENDMFYRPTQTCDRDMGLLVDSIRKYSVLNPLIITQDGYLISGHRRLAACKFLGISEAPCLTYPISHDDPEFVRLLREHNRYRAKCFDEVLREQLLDVTSEDAYQEILAYRAKRSNLVIDAIEIGLKKIRSKISAAKQPFLDEIISVIYKNRDFWPISDRQIHYRLLNCPPLRHASKPDSVYQNDVASYKSLVDLLTRARTEYIVPFSIISDETRPVSTFTSYSGPESFLKESFESFLTDYSRDYMQSQPNHIEILGEKNTVATIIERAARRYGIPYTIGRGYCSLRPRYDLVQRFHASGKENLIILILSDFDPDGEEIAYSFVRSLRDDFHVNAIAKKVALTAEQAKELALPKMMSAKESSSNYNKFIRNHGSDAVYELEAIPPHHLEKMLIDAIESVIDIELFNMEVEQEQEDLRSIARLRQIAMEALKRE